MARFDDYATRHKTARTERRGGMLQMTLHTGGPLQWGLLPHGELPQAFRDVGSDPDNQVVILTSRTSLVGQNIREAFRVVDDRRRRAYLG